MELRRWLVATRFLKGAGIEIGALHNPLKVPPEAQVRYLDRMSVAGLREHYPELAHEALVPVDIIDNGEKLQSIPEGSVDFVIANHFIEHCEDPIAAIVNMLRVLREGGNLYLAVPDKRFTFDALRPDTPIEHLVIDYKQGAKVSRTFHFEEWVQYIDKIEEEGERRKYAAHLNQKDYSIHFHVWTVYTFMEFIAHMKTVQGLPFELVHAQRNMNELILILRKSSGADFVDNFEDVPPARDESLRARVKHVFRWFIEPRE